MQCFGSRNTIRPSLEGNREFLGEHSYACDNALFLFVPGRKKTEKENEREGWNRKMAFLKGFGFIEIVEGLVHNVERDLESWQRSFEIFFRFYLSVFPKEGIKQEQTKLLTQCRFSFFSLFFKFSYFGGQCHSYITLQVFVIHATVSVLWG